MQPRRTLYYALGGGLGHLVRAGRFLRQQGLAHDALVLSASPHAADPRVLGGIASCEVPMALQGDVAALRDWLARCVDAFDPDLVCIDSFPAGILGELADFAPLRGRELWQLARLLRWCAYAPLAVGAPHYAQVWRLEPLHAGHTAWLESRTQALCDIRLEVPSAPPQPLADGRHFWVIAHSGPPAEVQALIAHAQEMRRIEAADVVLAVASFEPPPLPPDCIAVQAMPLAGYFAAAQRIIGAAGFNLIAETAAWRHKQLILPFPRRWDDQFARARRVRADLVAGAHESDSSAPALHRAPVP